MFFRVAMAAVLVAVGVASFYGVNYTRLALADPPVLPDPGEATRVGTATAFGVGEVEPRALVAIGDTLYMAGGQHDALFIVDTATGEATRVGNAHRFEVSEHWPAALAYMPPATD